MKFTFIILVLFLVQIAIFSQNNELKNDTSKHVTIIKMPEFNGKSGADGFSEYVSQNIVYPPKAIELGLEGIINVKFNIDTAGNLINPEIMKGVHEIVDNELLRVINTSPKWTPAISSLGKPVQIFYTLPIAFYPYEMSNRKLKRVMKKK